MDTHSTSNFHLFKSCLRRTALVSPQIETRSRSRKPKDIGGGANRTITVKLKIKVWVNIWPHQIRLASRNVVRFVWKASCGNKATVNKKVYIFLALAVFQTTALKKRKKLKDISKTQGCHDSTWLGSIHESYKHKPAAAASISPAACTQRTHSFQSGRPEKIGGWGATDRHFNLKEFFLSQSGYRNCVEGTAKTQSVLVYVSVYMWGSDKTDCFDMMSGELMSRIHLW